MTNNRFRNGPRGPYNPYASEYRGDGSKTAKAIVWAGLGVFVVIAVGLALN